jgi:hypothetical protein
MQKHKKYEKVRQHDTPKINSPKVTDIKDSKEESPDKEIKSIIIRMINELKEDMSKTLNECKEDLNKWLNKTRKTVQDMKEEFNKDTEL